MNIRAADSAAMERARQRWDGIAKPLGSLGLLEDAVVRIAGLTGSEHVSVKKRAVIVMCADNGVIAQGVSQSGSDVTRIVSENIANGTASVCRMSRAVGADVFAVDIGMEQESQEQRLIRRAVRRGTRDMTMGPAMTREEAQQAIDTGIDMVRMCAEKGYELLATGEMGIGNTTTSSAVASVLLRRDVTEMTGRGAGLSDEGLRRKIAAIEKAVLVNEPDPDDAMDVLAKLGGFDIAGLAGVFLGGGIYRIPVLIDGFISAVAALCAARICPESACAMLASHVSAEPAASCALDALGLKPLITAGMRLGEGTGAVCAMPLLDLALVEYDSMNSFDDIGVEQYKKY